MLRYDNWQVLGRSWQVAGDSGRRREARIRKTAPLSHCRPPSFANRIPHPQIPQVPESSQCNVQQWSRRQQATYGSLGREATKEERFLMPQLPQPQSECVASIHSAATSDERKLTGGLAGQMWRRTPVLPEMHQARRAVRLQAVSFYRSPLKIARQRDHPS